MEVECNFAELVDFLNSEIICSLEAAWILEDISLISDSFDCSFVKTMDFMKTFKETFPLKSFSQYKQL